MTTAAKPILRSARLAVRRSSNEGTGRNTAERWNARACGINSNQRSITTGKGQKEVQNNCCYAEAPRGGKIPTLNLYKDRRGASRKFLRNSQGGIPQKRETADCTSKLSEWICQKVAKSHLDMCMIGTELKGEMLRFLYLAASMSSTISLYNRTILRQYLENSDKM